MYLWHFYRRNDEELIKKVYKTQKLKTTKGDWYEMIQYEKKNIISNSQMKKFQL